MSKKAKQPELKGMPPKSPLQQEAEMYVGVWDRFQTAKSNLENAKKRLIDFAEKNAPGISKVTVIDDNGDKQVVELSKKDDMAVKVRKARKGE